MLALIAGCFATLPLANATPTPVPGNPGWDAKYKAAKVIAPSLGPAMDLPDNPRTDASGDKISSNAHSADYPGLYFYWDDKQKDNGTLLVNSEVFNMFVGGKFTLTAKNSNNYWGYTISKTTGTLIDGVYAFGIEKQIKYNELGNNGKVSAKTDDLKNINMVFIDGEYLPGYLKLNKIWLNEEGKETTGDNSLVSFKEGYKLGILNKIEIRTYAEAINGRNIIATENPILGFTTLANPQNVRVYQSRTTVPTFSELTFTNRIRTDLSYTVEYYYDGEIDDSKTDTFDGQTFGAVIDTYADKVIDGYVLESDTAPITIGTGDNVIQVFYVSVDFSVTIEYYMDTWDNKMDNDETFGDLRLKSTFTISDELRDKYLPEGYKFDSIRPSATIEVKLTGNVIQVLYVPKPFSFSVIDKIESEAHVGKWWAAGYGVIALGGSSVSYHNDDGDYMIALGAAANDVVYIGYGPDIDKLVYIFSFAKNGDVTVIKGDFDVDSMIIEFGGTVPVSSPPHGIGGGNWSEDLPVDVRFIFSNLYGYGGKMHIYLLDYSIA